MERPTAQQTVKQSPYDAGYRDAQDGNAFASGQFTTSAQRNAYRRGFNDARFRAVSVAMVR